MVQRDAPNFKEGNQIYISKFFLKKIFTLKIIVVAYPFREVQREDCEVCS